MDVKWVKIRSWHAVRMYADNFREKGTFCGREATGPMVDELPTEKSCESCLRIVARLNDQ